ncbi:uncharacterized protein LOC113520840 [Galleria mellonella]|uniref:Uncharacterized protein LOC113520840 n=2 Tax=Galleria mellonella TaxID=7137 RepID=A0A6J1WZR0_GALME|nr:uncharacterized protein LOC113520840 [Galleria mellonella]
MYGTNILNLLSTIPFLTLSIKLHTLFQVYVTDIRSTRCFIDFVQLVALGISTNHVRDRCRSSTDARRPKLACTGNICLSSIHFLLVLYVYSLVVYQFKNNFKIFAIRKKVKMTDKPKRPMSAYMLWLNSAREQIKADNPGLKVTEIAKKGGEIWRSMKDKSEWEEKAAEAKEQYTKDLESYNANGGGGEGGGKKAQKRGKKGKKASAPAKSKKKKEESEDDEGEEEEDEESE